MADDQVLARINDLADEEHALWTREADGTASDGDRASRAELEGLLDQCWDLLRQRRARRSAGLDPDGATARPVDDVENYRG